jgi:hypothetical protein
MLGHIAENFLLINNHFSISSTVSSVSALIALMGHSGSQTPQSIHSSGFIAKKFSPS